MEKTGINIAILGQSGVGKSSFCNYIFNQEIFTTDKGRPVTGWDNHFKSQSIDYQHFKLSIYDSVGIETDNFAHWKNELERFLQENGPSSQKPPMKWLHAVIYLINAASARVQPTELKLLESLANRKIPLHITLTNCDQASRDKISGIKKEITDHLGDIAITEVCSVEIKKRCGRSERKGKEETLNALLSKLDYELRSQIILYAYENYADVIRRAKKIFIQKIEESDFTLFNIIKAAIRDDGSFEIDDLIDFDLDQEFEKAIGDPQQALEDLDNFLVDLGFSSSNGNSTSDEIHRISERLLEDMEALGEKLTRKLDELTIAYYGDSFLEKAKATFKIAFILMDLKGFMKTTMGKMFDDALDLIETNKIKYNRRHYASKR